MKIFNFKINNPVHTAKIYNKRKVYYVKFIDSQITGLKINYPLTLIYSHFFKKLYLPLKERFMSLGRGTVYEKEMKVNIKIKKFSKILKNPVFYFIYNTANYYHFLYDTLPYLFNFFYLKKKIPKIKLLVCAPTKEKKLYKFVLECLNLLKINKNDLIYASNKVVYKELYIGSSLTHDGLSNHPPHKNIYKIINNLKRNSPKTEYIFDRIYISRRTWLNTKSKNIGTNYTIRRKFINEDAVYDLFKKRGFKEIFCENLSMIQKINLFKSAKFIAGPIGGGMANVIFSSRNAKIISINSPGFFDVNYRFKYCLDHANVFHFNHTKFLKKNKSYVSNNNALSISGGLNSPWEADINKLEIFLDKIL
jgi:capsular polysaccharide biosynthesis protein